MEAYRTMFYFVLLFVVSVFCITNVQCADEVLECTEAIQGDLLLNNYRMTSSGRRRRPRAAASNVAALWTNNTTPYTFDSRLSESQKRRIRKAMQVWQNKTCIRFVPRNNQSDYTTFTIGRGCCSNVGRQGGHQTLILGYGCYSHRIILHELGHLIGFWHEQGRPDRDDYVDILYGNISPGEIHQFGKKSASSVTSLGQPFDYSSVMLYGRNTFSKNNKKTIIPKLTTYNVKEQGQYYYRQHTSFGTSKLSSSDVLQANLLYKCPYQYENGHVLVGLHGNLTSRNFPKAYPKSSDFAWTIIAAEYNSSKMLVLRIDELNVGIKNPDGACLGDWLEIREGKGPKSPYLTKYCGQVTSVVTVFGDSLFIRLHSTNSTKNKSKPNPKVAAHQPLQHWWLKYLVKKKVEPAIGFSLRYKISDCKYVITQMNGSISSPSYPTTYRENIDCVWQISAPKGFRIHITFDDFDLREVDEEKGCFDYLEIREGTKVSSKFLSLNCGRNFPDDISTNSNNLRIFMHATSGTARRGQGFKARYRMEDIDECEGRDDLCEQGCVNYPGGYTCGCLSAYHIVGDGPEVRCLDVDECQTNNGGCSHYCTNTQGSHFCTCPPGYYLEKDRNTCKDSNECMLSICSQKCVNTPGSYICSCKYGYALDSDKKTCKLAIPMCTGVLSSNVGKFTSPPIPPWYRGSVDCEWTIRVRQPYTIGMYLTLSWSRDHQCSNSIKISFNEGSGLHSVKLCGHEDVDGLLHFKTYEIQVHYHTKAPYTEGFSLRYHMRPQKEQLCGGELYHSKGTIYSPNYPSFYPGRSTCLWKIKSPRGRGARLLFEVFDLEKQRHCKYDFVDIQTTVGSSGRIRPIGRFCGKKMPPLISNKNGELWIKFHSDGTVQRKGFAAKYQFK